MKARDFDILVARLTTGVSDGLAIYRLVLALRFLVAQGNRETDRAFEEWVKSRERLARKANK